MFAFDLKFAFLMCSGLKECINAKTFGTKHLSFEPSLDCSYILPSANHPEIIVSGGMTMPQIISPQQRIAQQNEKIPLNRIK